MHGTGQRAGHPHDVTVRASELQHAIKIAKQIDYLNGSPTNKPKAVKVSDKPKKMLQFDLENERNTLVNYRQRIQQADAMGDFHTPGRRGRVTSGFGQSPRTRRKSTFWGISRRRAPVDDQKAAQAAASRRKVQCGSVSSSSSLPLPEPAATGDVAHPHLGAVMLRSKMLTPAQLDDALRQQVGSGGPKRA